VLLGKPTGADNEHSNNRKPATMPTRGAIPGLKKLKKPNGSTTWYRVARQISPAAEDFRPRTIRLWHGVGEPSSEILADIKQRAETFTIDLKDWRLRSQRNRKSLADGHHRTLRKRGYIYVVRAVDRVKIGFSKDVKRRISELQTFFADELELLLATPGSIMIEHSLHVRFKEFAIKGEWFCFAEPIAAYVASELAQLVSQGRNRPSSIWR
jgi:hypothetical protein